MALDRPRMQMMNILLLFCVAQMPSTVMALACDDLFAGGRSTQPRTILRSPVSDPIEFWLRIQERATQSDLSGEGRLDFPVPEFRLTLIYMREQLSLFKSELLKRKEKNGAEMIATELDRMLGELEAINQRNIPYRTFLIFTYSFSKAMDLQEVLHQNAGYLSKDIEFIRDPMARPQHGVALDSFINKAPRFLLIPTHENLGLKPFIKARSAPIYLVGLVNKPTLADGREIKPSEFLEHDLFHAEIAHRVDQNRFENHSSESATDHVFQDARMINTWIDQIDRLPDEKIKDAARIVLFQTFHEEGLRPGPELIARLKDGNLVHDIYAAAQNGVFGSKFQVSRFGPQGRDHSTELMERISIAAEMLATWITP